MSLNSYGFSSPNRKPKASPSKPKFKQQTLDGGLIPSNLKSLNSPDFSRAYNKYYKPDLQDLGEREHGTELRSELDIENRTRQAIRDSLPIERTTPKAKSPSKARPSASKSATPQVISKPSAQEAPLVLHVRSSPKKPSPFIARSTIPEASKSSTDDRPTKKASRTPSRPLAAIVDSSSDSDLQPVSIAVL